MAARAVIAVRHRSSPVVRSSPVARRQYRVIAGVESAAAGLGADVLAVAGHAGLVPVWVCAVVGAHFFPLAPALHDRLLVPLGTLLCAVAVAALLAAALSSIAASTVTGLGAGGSLTAAALAGLIAAPIAPPAPGTASK